MGATVWVAIARPMQHYLSAESISLKQTARGHPNNAGQRDSSSMYTASRIVIPRTLWSSFEK